MTVLDDLPITDLHRKALEALYEIEPRWRELEEMQRPRPIEEYHEDMGAVLWWCWEPPVIPIEKGDEYRDGRWLGEPPYVGTPLDLGHEVAVKVETTIAAFSNSREGEHSYSLSVGGWPGYHTHFTLIPIPKEPTS